MPKRRRGGRRAGAETKRLYLVFDDWAWGYSIRELDLSPAGSAAAVSQRRLPRPLIRFEAPRGYPFFFTAVGGRIIATHSRKPFDYDSAPDCFLFILDVRSRGITFGPRGEYPDAPIYFPIGDELYALDTAFMIMLSLKPLCAPPLEEHFCRSEEEWLWREVPLHPFRRLEITSYVVHGRTILVSTTKATFSFDTTAHVWKQHGWTLPFTGRAHFVDRMCAFVGLSNDPATLGYLCSCRAEVAYYDGARLLGKKLFSEDPAERHVSATLVYMGGESGTEFCLVQCVSIVKGENANADQEPEAANADQEPEAANAADQELEVPRRCCYLYRLTTFSLSYDDYGELTTGETCRVQCYKVPEATTENFLYVNSGDPLANPVAFWL